MKRYLSIPEEILLLAIHENGGVDPHSKTLDVVLACSVLMDLAVHKRIDTENKLLVPVLNEPCGDRVLDKVLIALFDSPVKHTHAFWIAKIGFRAEELKEVLIASLVEKGILKIENKKVFWLFKTRKYPVVNDIELKDVKARIRDLVFTDNQSDLHDMAILSLINYGGMLPFVFDEAEFHLNKTRIAELARLNVIGESISDVLASMSPSFQLANLARDMIRTKTPQEKLDQLVEEMKTKYHITNEEDLPDWLRKGTPQYQKTLEFITKTGTNQVYYHHLMGEYYVKDSESAFSM